MAEQKKDSAKQAKEKKEATFTKEQLVKSDKYADRQDALRVVLKNNKSYTFSEVDEALKKFMKGKVDE